MRFITIAGVRYEWKSIRQLRREQIAAARSKREPRDKSEGRETIENGPVEVRPSDAH
jgi:hypothetical protein